MQEISFWLNLERALLRIQDIRESPDIALTLDILKHGKRFHATVSFDTDTGTVKVYLNPSFPVGTAEPFIHQTGDENTQTYQVEVVILIQH